MLDSSFFIRAEISELEGFCFNNIIFHYSSNNPGIKIMQSGKPRIEAIDIRLDFVLPKGEIEFHAQSQSKDL